MKAAVFNEPQITCPKCKTAIKLTESLAAPLIAKTRKQFEQQLADKQSDFAKRESTIRKAQTDIKKQRESIDEEIEAKLELQRSHIAQAEAKKARLALAADLKNKDRQLYELHAHLKANNSKLIEAQRAQIDMIRKARELDDAKREVELSVQKRVQDGLDEVRSRAKADAEQKLKARVTEKELQITGLQRKINELQRKSEQGSQQLQGEALEVDLEVLLRQRFPQDVIEPVSVGVTGGDIAQTVINRSGQQCGLILWETKSTKSWNDSWLSKLRDNQRASNATVALLVSQAMPKGTETFDLIDGIWVSRMRFALPLATALRHSIIEISATQQAISGQRTKIELVYSYLTGPKFRQRMEAIVEHFTEMQLDLDRERKVTLRLWAKREQQLKGVLESSAGMYGDLQGIAGQALPEIRSLDMLLLDSKSM
jgi:hypothetical protein